MTELLEEMKERVAQLEEKKKPLKKQMIQKTQW